MKDSTNYLRFSFVLHAIQVIMSFTFVQVLQLDTINAKIGPSNQIITRYHVAVTTPCSISV